MAPCRRQLDRIWNLGETWRKVWRGFWKSPPYFSPCFRLRNYYIIKYRHQTLFFGVGSRPPEVCVAQHKEAYPMRSAPPPPPTALPVAAMVMVATTTATVTAAGVATTTTAVGASTVTTAAAAATATRQRWRVDTNNKQQSTKCGSGRLGG